MEYDELAKSLIFFRKKIKEYECQIINISYGILKESPQSWIKNISVSYKEKESELKYLENYFREHNRIQDYEFIKELKKKLYEQN